MASIKYELVDSIQLDECLYATAEGIREKTKTDDAITFDFENRKGFADAIAAIPSGGGLPSSISKIDGGTFIVTNHTLVSSYSISHNLGEKPDGVCIFAESISLKPSIQTLLGCVFVAGDGSLDSSFGRLSYKKENSTVFASSSIANTASLIDKNQICIDNSSSYYNSTIEYKWIAWVK